MDSTYTMPTESNTTWAAFADTASGPWTVVEPIERPRVRRLTGGFLRPFGISIAVALSPLTAVTDPWLLERRRQSQATAYVSIDTVGRRRISLREAGQRALQLLVDAEAARLGVAEAEARRAFELEEPD